MNVDWVRKTCLALPHTTEHIQWGNDLVFKVGGKMFAVCSLEPAPVCLSFKASDENFAMLIERPKIIPAPYLARAKWVALESEDALPFGELGALLAESHQLVMSKLPKSLVRGLEAGKKRSASVRVKRRSGKTRKRKGAGSRAKTKRR